MADMIFLIVAAVMTGVLGFIRMVQLHDIQAPLSERLIFGFFLVNMVYTLLYPLSEMALGWWPLGLTGLAFSGWMAIRFLHAKSDQVGHYRGSVLSR